MDRASIGGIALALLGIIIGQSIDGGKLSSLLQLSAFIIVICGTFGAVLLQSTLKNFNAAFHKLRFVFFEPINHRPEIASILLEWSQIARKEGTLHLEPIMEETADPFIKKVLRLVVDGATPNTIREIGAIELNQYELSERNAIKVWDSAGGYSPTIGILAAVIGLIHVMENLSDPSLIGGGIAIAFVSTIYGVGLANLILIPIANKLKTILQDELANYEMLIDGLASIANGDHTIVLEDRVSSYLQ
jgi:chemotaxis protein MotA